MPDYKLNPLFNSQISKLDPNHIVSFDYVWDESEEKWVPSRGITLNVDNLDLDIEANDVKTHDLLSGISGVLEGQQTEDFKTHELLSGISDILNGQETEDTQTHELLSGISGILDGQETEDTQTHELLSGISGILDGQETEDTKTHALLSGISGILDGQQTEDTQTHALLGDISSILSNLNTTSDDFTTHELLSGISGELSDIHIDVELDSDTKTHELLSGVQYELQNLTVDLGDITVTSDDKETHRILSGISGQDNSHYEENEKFLSGISGQDETHYIENERLLMHIKDSAENLTLSIEELKRNYVDLTFHTKKFGIPGSNILSENSPESSSQRKTFQESLYNALDTDEIIDRENIYINNSEQIISEDALIDPPQDRIGSNDETAPYIIKQEPWDGDYNGWYKFTPLAKPVGNDDRITIFNDDETPLEILFRGGEGMKIYGGYKIELTKAEAYKAFLRKKYALDGFEIGYTLERMYCPEQSLLGDIEEHTATQPQNTHSLITLGSFWTDNKYLYVSHGKTIKRVAIASWELISTPLSTFTESSNPLAISLL